MQLYLAPMEGMTTYIYRQAYHKYYGAATRYFTPFIANSGLSSRDRNEILPEHNEGMCTIPQLLTNRASDFLSITKEIAEYGYDTFNLNLGCPAPTVVTRKRGSGFLSVPDELDRFLDEIFSKSPYKISIKTRIGVHDVEEWEDILEVYRKYPLEELIIHPRLQREGYGGKVHLDCYRMAQEVLQIPLCYNGDLVTYEGDYGSLEWFRKELPHTETIMVGRGIIQNPGYLCACVDAPLNDCKQNISTPGIDASSDPAARLRAFHDELLHSYTQVMSGDANTLFKMKDLWTFMANNFKDSEKHLKKIRKASRLSDYTVAVHAIFRECEYIAPSSPIL